MVSQTLLAVEERILEENSMSEIISKLLVRIAYTREFLATARMGMENEAIMDNQVAIMETLLRFARSIEQS